MKRVVADANVFLRFLLEDVPAQAEQAARLLSKAKLRAIKLSVLQITIFEIHFSLEKYYKLSKDQIVDKIGTIISTPYLDIQDRNGLQNALALYNGSHIDFVDCFMICATQDAGAELFTFDEDLQKLAVLHLLKEK